MRGEKQLLTILEQEPPILDRSIAESTKRGSEWVQLLTMGTSKVETESLDIISASPAESSTHTSLRDDSNNNNNTSRGQTPRLSGSKRKAALGIIQLQSLWRMLRDRKRYLRIKGVVKERNYRLKKKIFAAWIPLRTAIRHYKMWLRKMGFAGMLGFSNIVSLKRQFALDKLQKCRKQQTIQNIIIMWYRYTMYIQTQVNVETGFRRKTFSMEFPLWDVWVEKDAYKKRLRERVHTLNFGDKVLSCLLEWVNYTHRRRAKRERNLLAEAHNCYTLQRKSFTSWMMLSMNKLQLQALEKATLSFYISRWVTYINERHEQSRLLECAKKITQFRFLTIWKRRFDLLNVTTTAALFRLVHHRPLALLALSILIKDDILLCTSTKWRRWKAYIRGRKFFRLFVSKHYSLRMTQLAKTVLRCWHHVVIANDVKRVARLRGCTVPVLVPMIDTVKLKEEYLDFRKNCAEQSRIVSLSSLSQRLLHASEQTTEYQPTVAKSNKDNTFFVTRTAQTATISSALHSEVSDPNYAKYTRSQHLTRHQWELWKESANGDCQLFNKVCRLLLLKANGSLSPSMLGTDTAGNYYCVPVGQQKGGLQDPLLIPYSVREESEKRNAAADDRKRSLAADPTAAADFDDPFERENAVVNSSFPKKDPSYETSDALKPSRSLLADHRNFRLEKAKVLLASLGPPFYDSNTHNVDVPNCLQFLEEHRRSLFIEVLGRQRRENRIVYRFLAQRTAIRIHLQNPAFTVDGLGPSDIPFLTQRLFYCSPKVPIVKTAKPGQEALKDLKKNNNEDPQELETCNEQVVKKVKRSFNYPILRYLIFKHLQDLIGDIGRKNVLMFKQSKIKVAKVIELAEYQIHRLPIVVDNIPVETRNRRIANISKLQYKTAFEPKFELQSKFQAISKKWEKKLLTKSIRCQPYSILNLVGFNPALVRKPVGRNRRKSKVAEVSTSILETNLCGVELHPEVSNAKLEELRRVNKKSLNLSPSNSLQEDSVTSDVEHDYLLDDEAIDHLMSPETILSEVIQERDQQRRQSVAESSIDISHSELPNQPSSSDFVRNLSCDSLGIDEELDRILDREAKQELKRLEAIREKAEEEARATSMQCEKEKVAERDALLQQQQQQCEQSLEEPDMESDGGVEDDELIEQERQESLRRQLQQMQDAQLERQRRFSVPPDQSSEGRKLSSSLTEQVEELEDEGTPMMRECSFQSQNSLSDSSPNSKKKKNKSSGTTLHSPKGSFRRSGRRPVTGGALSRLEKKRLSEPSPGSPGDKSQEEVAEVTHSVAELSEDLSDHQKESIKSVSTASSDKNQSQNDIIEVEFNQLPDDNVIPLFDQNNLSDGDMLRVEVPMAREKEQSDPLTGDGVLSSEVAHQSEHQSEEDSNDELTTEEMLLKNLEIDSSYPNYERTLTDALISKSPHDEDDDSDDNNETSIRKSVPHSEDNTDGISRLQLHVPKSEVTSAMPINTQTTPVGILDNQQQSAEEFDSKLLATDDKDGLPGSGSEDAFMIPEMEFLFKKEDTAAAELRQQQQRQERLRSEQESFRCILESAQLYAQPLNTGTNYKTEKASTDSCSAIAPPPTRDPSEKPSRKSIEVLLDISTRYSTMLNYNTRIQLQELQNTVYPILLTKERQDDDDEPLEVKYSRLIESSSYKVERLQRRVNSQFHRTNPTTSQLAEEKKEDPPSPPLISSKQYTTVKVTRSKVRKVGRSRPIFLASPPVFVRENATEAGKGTSVVLQAVDLSPAEPSSSMNHHKKILKKGDGGGAGSRFYKQAPYQHLNYTCRHDDGSDDLKSDNKTPVNIPRGASLPDLEELKTNRREYDSDKSESKGILNDGVGNQRGRATESEIKPPPTSGVKRKSPNVSKTPARTLRFTGNRRKSSDRNKRKKKKKYHPDKTDKREEPDNTSNSTSDENQQLSSTAIETQNQNGSETDLEMNNSNSIPMALPNYSTRLKNHQSNRISSNKVLQPKRTAYTVIPVPTMKRPASCDSLKPKHPKQKVILQAKPIPLTLPIEALAVTDGRRVVKTCGPNSQYRMVSTEDNDVPLPTPPLLVQNDYDHEYWNKWLFLMTQRVASFKSTTTEDSAMLDDLYMQEETIKRKLAKAQELMFRRQIGSDSVVATCSERLESVCELIKLTLLRQQKIVSSVADDPDNASFKSKGVDSTGHAVRRLQVASIKSRARLAIGDQENFRRSVLGVKKAAADNKLPQVSISNCSIIELISVSFRAGQFRLSLALLRKGRQIFPTEWWAQPNISETAEQLWGWFYHLPQAPGIPTSMTSPDGQFPFLTNTPIEIITPQPVSCDRIRPHTAMR